MKVLFACLAIVALGIGYAPGFLVYSYPLDKVDCIMVMVGTRGNKRLEGAEWLMKQGRANALLIPAYHQVSFAKGPGWAKGRGLEWRRGSTARVTDSWPQLPGY